MNSRTTNGAVPSGNGSTSEDDHARDLEIVSTDDRMREVYRLIDKAKDCLISVLIQGETGTGKELVARRLHDGGPRRSGPFIAVNCASIPNDLLESELFGHERGAFTGAHATKRGKFELADGGTLFLDEIGELAPLLQAKLLRALETRTFERVGGTETLHADIRILSATCRDLRALVAAGKFREDLFFRLAQFPIALPALRDRLSDIMVLAEAFLRGFAVSHGRGASVFAEGVGEMLMAYPWPGNVRELKHSVEFAVLMSDGDMIRAADFPCGIAVAPLDGGDGPANGHVLAIVPLEALKENAVRQALIVSGNNIFIAAKSLGVARSTLYQMIKKYRVVI